MRPAKRSALGAALALLGHAVGAGAYCRTTTCGTTDPSASCTADASGCMTEGTPLFWAERCVSFTVNEKASPKWGIGYPAASEAIRQGYRTWMSAPCSGGPPSIEAWDLGEPNGVVCDQKEFNPNRANTNLWVFLDDAWPNDYDPLRPTIALTWVNFDTDTGEILDTDVQINTYDLQITTDPNRPVNDLQSIATHETGHVLGFGHSSDPAATMWADYNPKDLSFRSLHSDDVAAVCTVYPHDRAVPACPQPRPVNGFSPLCGADQPQAQPAGCGCRLGGAATSSAQGPGEALLLALSGTLAGLAVGRRRGRATRR